MLSAFNFRLSLIEQTLTRHSCLLARLQLVEFEVRAARNESIAATTDDINDSRQLVNLREWVRRLRVQVARTLRRVERLRAVVARHDAELADIRSRVLRSSGGCAVIRPAHSHWTSRHGKWQATPVCHYLPASTPRSAAQPTPTAN